MLLGFMLGMFAGDWIDEVVDRRSIGP